jgi:iron complex outermembrane recepter protein
MHTKSQKQRWMLGVAAGLGALLTGAPSDALAQTTENVGVDDIIVTARRTEENLQDAPVAVTAFSGAQLEARGIEAVADLPLSTPNLNITQGIAGGSSSNAAIFIRGIGQRDFIPTVDPGVGVYRDGVYLGRSVGSNLDFADIERVEVLRGPQGTLFGKNTIGGAINIITERPSDTNTWEASLRLGERGRADVDLLISGPLSETVSGKLVFASRFADGYMDRITDGRQLSDENRQMLRGELLFQPSPDLDILLAADAMTQNQESRAGNALFIDLVNPNTGMPTIIGNWNVLVAPGLGLDPLTTASANFGDPYTIAGTSPSYDDMESWGLSMTIDRDLSFGSFRSTTAYRGFTSSFSAPIQPIFANLNDFEQTQFSQEFQWFGSAFADKLDWLFGLYYFHEEADALSGARLWTGLTITIPSLAACQAGTGIVCQDFNSNNDLSTTGDSYSAYGQISYDLSERLRLTLGGRYTYEEKDFSVRAVQLQINRVAADGAASDSWENFSPLVSLDYTLTDEAMVYARVAQGFKSGGFNGRPNNTNAVQPVDPETVTSYEIGAKTEWFDRRLRANLAFYFNSYEDYQEVVSITDPTFGLLSLVENIGELETQGLELELTARPTESLTLYGSVGVADAEYVDVGATTSFGVEDKPVQIPDLTGSLGLQYVQDFANGAALTWRTDWSYNSGYENYLNNVRGGPTDNSYRNGLQTESFEIVNARLTYTPSAEAKWEASLYARNLLDETYIVAAGYNFGSGFASSVPNAPREIGVQFTLRH